MPEEIHTTLPPTPPAAHAEGSSFLDRMNKGSEAATDTTTTTTTAPPVATTTLPPENGSTTKPPRVAKRFQNHTTLPPLTHQQGLDVKEIVSEVFKKVEERDEKNKPKAEELGETLTAKEKKRLEVLAELEVVYPENKGLTDKARKWMLEAPGIQDKFKKEHPQATTEEIESFLVEQEESRGIKWDDDEYDEARINLMMKPKEQALKKAQEEVAELKTKDHLATVQPIARAVGEDAVDTAIEIIGGEFKETYSDKKFDDAKWQKLAEEDPVTTRIVGNAIVRTRDFAEAAAACFSGAHQHVNPVLKDQVLKFSLGFEAEIQALPPEQQRNEDGKPFVPREKYTTLSPAERAKVWTTTGALVASVAAQRIANAAKEDVETELKAVQKTAAKRFGAPAVTAAPVTAAPVHQTQPPARKPRPDSVDSKAGAGGGAPVVRGVPEESGFARRMRMGSGAA